MVIVRLKGGLGNQLFQYAHGREFAKKCNTPFYLDTSFYLDPKLNLSSRSYALHKFKIIQNFPDPIVLNQFDHRPNFLRKFFYKIGLGDEIETDQIVYSKTSGDIYLDGYWQGEKYFKNSEKIIRNEFRLKRPLSKQAKIISQKIDGSENPISIHIRRGDYISIPKINFHHGVCSLEYYISAINKISGIIKNVHHFIFSDDIKWATSNIKTNSQTTIVSQAGITDEEELVLMSSCHHHIIANSSFSWWGAWLNPNPTKIVISPKRWYTSTKIDTSDLIPKSWISI